MTNLKDLVNKFSKNENSIIETNTVNSQIVSQNTSDSNDQEQFKVTLKQKGHSESTLCQGNPLIFQTALTVVHRQFIDRIGYDLARQTTLKGPLIASQERKRNEKKGRDVLIENKQKECDSVDINITDLNNLVHDVKQNPLKHGIPTEQNPTSLFWIGLTILIGLTIYLFIYYTSIFYSAFFKIYDANTSVVEAMLDGHALSKADGIGAKIFLVTVPFIFLGLGFLIHMLNLKNIKEVSDKKKYRFSLTHGLLILTFTFDAILAYLIAQHMFLVTAGIGAVFNLQTAFLEPDFWIIIFCGFLVYVVWGHIFGFVMKEHELKDRITMRINALREQIVKLENRKQENQTTIKDYQNDITRLNGEIIDLEAQINGVIIPHSEYEVYHAEFTNGWFMGIAALPISDQRKDQILAECQIVSENFLNLMP